VKKVIVVGFLCGFLAVLVIHQPLIYVLHHQFPLIQSITGAADAFRPQGAGFNIRPVAPLGVPQVVSLAFWGGLYGILLAALIRWARMPDLLTGFLVGVLATVVGFTLVATLRGTPLWGGGNPLNWYRGILFNGAWGWGAALLMRPFQVTPER
jgi:xanthine/uracil permease